MHFSSTCISNYTEKVFKNIEIYKRLKNPYNVTVAQLNMILEGPSNNSIAPCNTAVLLLSQKILCIYLRVFHRHRTQAVRKGVLSCIYKIYITFCRTNS